MRLGCGGAIALASKIMQEFHGSSSGGGPDRALVTFNDYIVVVFSRTEWAKTKDKLYG